MDGESITPQTKIYKKVQLNAGLDLRNSNPKFIQTLNIPRRQVYTRQARRNTVDSLARTSESKNENISKPSFDLHSWQVEQNYAQQEIYNSTFTRNKPSLLLSRC